jgi:hypothetical protein
MLVYMLNSLLKASHIYKMVSVTFCPVLSCSVLSGIGGQTAGPIWSKIVTNTHWDYAMKIGGRRTRVRIDARANVLAAPHIQHRRPNGWTDQAPNWYKHSLGLCDEDRVVGDRECALMRAQPCALHHISSIDYQTAGPIGPNINTNTNWDYAMMIGGLAIASAH